MAVKIVMIDTSILIDFYRKSDKKNAAWIALIAQRYEFAISAITKYEIYSGATDSQMQFWNEILSTVQIISLNEASVDAAVNINAVLKRKRKQIDLADLLIAATAIAYNLPFATLNKKHFERVEGLNIIE